MLDARRGTGGLLCLLALLGAVPGRAATPAQAAATPSNETAEERTKLVLRIEGPLGAERETALAGFVSSELAANRVTLHVELLNSKVDHRDYQGDRTGWGVEVMKGVGSPNVKLLYDIYHMQIMEGDVIRTIRDNIQYLGHFHTGGVPGRNELDGTQELNYNAIAKAIADTGFQGYVAHEFMPKRDPLTSLREAYEVMRV